MRIGHTHSDVYDRESDYWRDMEDALPKEKNSNSSANENESRKNKVTRSIAQNSEIRTVEDK